MSPETTGYLVLRERALALVTRQGPVAEDELLVHVYGAHVPARLRAQLLAPLRDDRRLARQADGRWAVAQPSAGTPPPGLAGLPFTALAVAASGPRPARDRVVAIAGVHVLGGQARERFSARLNPTRRVPGYVAARAGLGSDELDQWPPFAGVREELLVFLGERPICAQEARLAWAYLADEAKRANHPLSSRPLLDLGELADAVLELPGKPSLSAIAERVGVNYLRVGHPDEEARVVGQVAARLLERAQAAGLTTLPALQAALGRGRIGPAPLRQPATARALPDQPGVYVLRDAGARALYVGKARRLQSRLRAYVSRPLGATRRLEGLADAVDSVDPRPCPTDLEALVLEAREIRRLRPRFNTQRHLRARPTWIRLPPAPRPGAAPRRLQLSRAPADDGGRSLGPFRNAHAARQVRALARALFQLDQARRTEAPDAYAARLAAAWAFLEGAVELGQAAARRQRAAALAARDHAAARRWQRLLAEAGAYDPRALLLPADPRQARYAVLRPGPHGIELFLLDRGLLVGRGVLGTPEPGALSARLAAHPEPLTDADDVEVVLGWLGSQRPPARLVHLPDGGAATARAIEAALSALIGASAEP